MRGVLLSLGFICISLWYVGCGGTGSGARVAELNLHGSSESEFAASVE